MVRLNSKRFLFQHSTTWKKRKLDWKLWTLLSSRVPVKSSTRTWNPLQRDLFRVFKKSAAFSLTRMQRLLHKRASRLTHFGVGVDLHKVWRSQILASTCWVAVGWKENEGPYFHRNTPILYVVVWFFGKKHGIRKFEHTCKKIFTGNTNANKFLFFQCRDWKQREVPKLVPWCCSHTNQQRFQDRHVEGSLLL